MTHYERKRWIAPFQNNGRMYDPKDLFTNDWRFIEGTFSNRITSDSLNINLYITKKLYNKFSEKHPFKEGELMAFSTFGWITQEEYYLSEDLIEEVENTQFKRRELKKYSVYEDVLGDKYFITKDKLIRTYLSSGKKVVFKNNLPLFKIAKEENLDKDESWMNIFGKNSIMSANSLNKLSFQKEIGFSDISKYKTKKSLLLKSQFNIGSILNSFESSRTIKLEALNLDPREYLNKNTDNLLERLWEELNNESYSLLFILNKKYNGFHGNFNDLENQDGELYIHRRTFKDAYSSLKYHRINDISRFKKELQNEDFNIYDFVNEDDYFDFGQSENHYILPSVFIGD